MSTVSLFCSESIYFLIKLFSVLMVYYIYINMKGSANNLFQYTSITPQPTGSIQFSTPHKPKYLTPKGNSFINSSNSPQSNSSRIRVQSFNDIHSNSMTHSSVFPSTRSEADSKQTNNLSKLQFKVTSRAASNRKSLANDLSKYAIPVLIAQQHPYERKVSNPYSIIVSSETTIPHQQQKMTINPEFRIPFQKNKLDFGQVRSRVHPKNHNKHCIEDFQIGKKIGKGNFGDVFMAKHKLLGLLFALKIIPKRIVKQKKMQTQLLWEATIQMTLNHPNIVSLYGMFDNDQNIYFIQQLIMDGHLFAQMRKNKRFEEEQAAKIMAEVCNGVQYMHRMEIIHRDIKPQNILIQLGVHKICDFGWAVYSPNSMRGTYCGTPLYMSPELLKGQKYDESVDNWALGILTYELLIGRAPFKIKSTEQLVKIITQQVQFPQYVNISDYAKQFILKLLNKDPQKRTELDALLEHPFLKEGESQKIKNNLEDEFRVVI